MAKGDVQARRKRRAPHSERIALRVAKFCERCAPGECPEGVQPLNPGFFALERMRQRTIAGKKRADKRGKVRSK